MVDLPIHDAVTFVLVRPHYPENVGAAARAIKTMGFRRLALVKPGRLAQPDHEMALKMAVKSRDVLAAAALCASIEEATRAAELVIATTSRRGVSGILEPKPAARLVLDRVASGGRVAILFGNEKTGLAAEEVARADVQLRIPMAADQPSINLAQAAQLVAYELFVAALAENRAERS
jgi:tRNA (cytidine32/uridine32-2'-O)-methyltransferase